MITPLKLPICKKVYILDVVNMLILFVSVYIQAFKTYEYNMPPNKPVHTNMNEMTLQCQKSKKLLTSRFWQYGNLSTTFLTVSIKIYSPAIDLQ